MQLHLKKSGKFLVMILSGSIRAEDNAAFEEALKDYRLREAPGVLLDISKLEYLNSRAIGGIMSLWKELSGLGRDFAIIRPAPLVERLLESVGMLSFVQVFDSLTDGIKAMSKAP